MWKKLLINVKVEVVYNVVVINYWWVKRIREKVIIVLKKSMLRVINCCKRYVRIKSVRLIVLKKISKKIVSWKRIEIEVIIVILKVMVIVMIIIVRIVVSVEVVVVMILVSVVCGF